MKSAPARRMQTPLNPTRARKIQPKSFAQAQYSRSSSICCKISTMTPNDGMRVLFLVARCFLFVVWMRRREMSNALEGATHLASDRETTMKGLQRTKTDKYSRTPIVSDEQKDALPHVAQKVK